jgi:hypothetical protein
MTDQPDHVVISYVRFVEYQERRRRIAADSAPPQPPTTDTDTPPISNHPPDPVKMAWRQS